MESSKQKEREKFYSRANSLRAKQLSVKLTYAQAFEQVLVCELRDMAVCLPYSTTLGVLGKDLVTVLPKDVFEVGQIISDDAVKLDGGSGLVMFLSNLPMLFVHQKHTWHCTKNGHPLTTPSYRVSQNLFKVRAQSFPDGTSKVAHDLQSKEFILWFRVQFPFFRNVQLSQC